MTITDSNIEIQIIHKIPESMSKELIKEAVLIAYKESNRAYDFDISVNVRIVGTDEGTEINRKFKHKNGPTNVLAFVGEPDRENNLGVGAPSLGDIVVCYPVVEKESDEMKEVVERHFVHMIIHGFLHLMGYDHQNDLEEHEMNELANKILRSVIS